MDEEPITWKFLQVARRYHPVIEVLSVDWYNHASDAITLFSLDLFTQTYLWCGWVSRKSCGPCTIFITRLITAPVSFSILEHQLALSFSWWNSSRAFSLLFALRLAFSTIVCLHRPSIKFPPLLWLSARLSAQAFNKVLWWYVRCLLWSSFKMRDHLCPHNHKIIFVHPLNSFI